MTIDQHGLRFWNRFSPAQKAAFFSCLITGYLVHLYAFTNTIPNSDGLSRVFDLQQMTVSGRWFLHYASALNNFTQMPTVIGLLSVLFLAVAALFVVDLLQIQSKVLGGLSGAIMAAFPCLGYTFLYMFTASAYCLAILLAALSVWLALRCKTGWLLGVVSLALAMGTYQAYVTVAISLSLLVVFRMTLDPDATFRKTLQLGLRLVAYLTAGAVLYYVILLVFLKVKDLQLLSYLGMDSASSSFSLGRLPFLLFDCYKQVVAFFLVPGSADAFLSPWMLAGNIILIGCGIALLIFRLLKTKQDYWRIFGSLAMIALLPLGMNFMQILTPQSVPTPLMKYSFLAPYLLVLMLFDLTETEPVFRKRYAAGLVGIVILLLTFLNTNNLLYTASNQAHRATESYATRLVSRIEGCPGYKPGMDVAIIGAIPTDQIYAQVESYAQVDHYSVPFDSVAPLNKHIYYYLNDWLNVPVEELSEETMLAISQSPEFQAMPLYPADGSVQILDGRVVVRIQETYTPKSDYEIAYENRR